MGFLKSFKSWIMAPTFWIDVSDLLRNLVPEFDLSVLLFGIYAIFKICGLTERLVILSKIDDLFYWRIKAA